MTLDERIKKFTREFPRPPKGNTWMTMTHLVYDLIDARHARATLDKIQVDISEVMEESERLRREIEHLKAELLLRREA